MIRARYALAPLILLIAGAGAGAVLAESPSPSTSLAADEVVSIANEGGAREGHTPTAFAGMGTGLFAGDNLNAAFPDGVGVQTYLTFALPPDLTVSAAQLVSDALRVTGTPFEDLGPLLAEPVSYETFGPDLFDLAAIGPFSGCDLSGQTSIRCDVTDAVQAALADGRAEAQFRIRFAEAADDDGRADLALFFRTDSNTNEAGLFELEITPDS